MIYVFFVISCIVFIELFIFLNLQTEAAKIITRSREAMGVVISSELDDDAKEAFMRRAAIEMFKATFIFAIKFLLIVVVLYAMYWLLVRIFPELRYPILESLVSPIIIIGVTFAAMSYAWVRNVIIKQLQSS